MTQLHLKHVFSIIYAVLRTWRSIAAAIATPPRADCSSMEGHTSLSTSLVGIGYNGCARIDDVRLFAKRCYFGHSIGVLSFVGQLRYVHNKNVLSILGLRVEL